MFNKKSTKISEEQGTYSIDNSVKNPISIKYTSPKKEVEINCEAVVMIALENYKDEDSKGDEIKSYLVQEGKFSPQNTELLIESLEQCLKVLKLQAMEELKSIIQEALEDELFERGY